jgi:hypothetical protein
VAKIDYVVANTEYSSLQAISTSNTSRDSGHHQPYAEIGTNIAKSIIEHTSLTFRNELWLYGDGRTFEVFRVRFRIH